MNKEKLRLNYNKKILITYQSIEMNLSLFSSFGAIARNILSEAILQLNRNARAPKKANHGARPCSSVMRR